MAKIYHTHLYGDRDSKYGWLQDHNVLSTNWKEVRPQAPFYLLIPQNIDLLGEYEHGWKITDMMPVSSNGVITHRDHFAIDFDKEELKKRISQFRDLQISNDVIATQYRLSDTRDWKINSHRMSLAKNEKWEYFLTKCLYRPFDVRFYYHHEDVTEFPRNEVMDNLFNRSNLGLATTRLITSLNFCHVFCTEVPIEKKSCSHDRSTNVFPLYLYPEHSELTQDRRVNFSQKFLNDITGKLGYLPTPEEIFYYIYSLFHSSIYRRRYAEFLKTDFPRIPLTSNNTLFQQLATHGEKLIALHLMKSSTLDTLITQFEGICDPVVDSGHPKYVDGKVIINKKGDGFTGVAKEVWNFYVGGYQVCQKWLKDRKGRILSPEDIIHYQRIVVALQETILLMQQIDEIIPGFPLP